MFKKVFVGILVSLYAVLGVSVFATPAVAAGTPCANAEWLGIPAWYNGLECDGDSVKSPDDTNDENMTATKKFVWTIIANIGSMILGVAAYVAIGMITYGGIRYMLGGNDPGKVAKAKKTITNAVIGLVICAVARTIITTIREIFINAASKATSVWGLMQELLNPLFLWAGILGVIVIVISGFEYALAAGDPGKVASAKRRIMGVAIGLVIVFSAAAFVNLVLGEVQ